MTGADLRGGTLVDAALAGLRITMGVAFILHAFPGKFSPRFEGFMGSFGVPPELVIFIALGELIPGILLIPGFLSRISASVLAIIMIAAIFTVHGAESFVGGDNAFELPLVYLAVSLLIIVAGPGRMSASHAIGRLVGGFPRFAH